MDLAMQSVIGAIHASSTRAVLCLAGGASQMPDQFVSETTAKDMAYATYNRSLQLSVPGTPVVGIGFTGTLVSAVPKRGDHRCHVCARMRDHIWEYQFTFTKGLRNREKEDFVASQILIKALASSSCVNIDIPIDIQGTEKLMETQTHLDEASQIRELIEGRICMLPYTYGAGFASDDNSRRVILSGSFNPLHEGHLKLMDTACSMIGGVPIFEISVVNADKPPLSFDEIKSRAAQFEAAGKTVIFTSQPYFFKKAELFPNSTFVVGADTAVRLVNPKYYDGSHSRMLEVLHGMQNLGCDFLVAGRMVDGHYLTFVDLNIPDDLEMLFKAIPAEAFRVDISSTEIRGRQAAGSA
ncbi:hypothetical protein KP509_21G080500 [Ceratopteris richardii]|uniref:Cytidyltransferase-like domain-containing protein n=1 Tax=Ceratopteris richardii TaxID=49495 RepID=A0A8T2SDV8_CERRI|nr:hypothetical protein KP509_21G080500 [Ceratopteris richardii]